MILLIRDKTLNQIIDRVISTVLLICLKGNEMAFDPATQASTDALKAAVAANTSIKGSVDTLLDGLAAQLAALKTGKTDPAVLAIIDEATAIVLANNKEMGDHVLANTSVTTAGASTVTTAGASSVPGSPVSAAAEAPVTTSGTDAPPDAPPV